MKHEIYYHERGACIELDSVSRLAVVKVLPRTEGGIVLDYDMVLHAAEIIKLTGDKK